VSLPAPLPLVVGNWKMNFDEAATASLVADLTRRLSFERAEVAVAPPFPSLRAALDAAYNNGVLVLRIPIAEKAKPRKIAVAGQERTEQKVITG